MFRKHALILFSLFLDANAYPSRRRLRIFIKKGYFSVSCQFVVSTPVLMSLLVLTLPINMALKNVRYFASTESMLIVMCAHDLLAASFLNHMIRRRRRVVRPLQHRTWSVKACHISIYMSVIRTICPLVALCCNWYNQESKSDNRSKNCFSVFFLKSTSIMREHYVNLFWTCSCSWTRKASLISIYAFCFLI